MNTPNYPDTMSATEADDKSAARTARTPTIVFVAVVVLLNLIQQLTDWSRWVFFVPAAIISGAIIAYYWARNRRREAEAVSSG